MKNSWKYLNGRQSSIISEMNQLIDTQKKLSLQTKENLKHYDQLRLIILRRIFYRKTFCMEGKLYKN